MEKPPVTTATPPEARRVARLIIGTARPPVPPRPTPPPAWKPGPVVAVPGKNKDTAQLALGAKRRKPAEDLRREIATTTAGTKTAVDALKAMGIDTVAALQGTKNYSRSDGLKALVKLVKEIDVEHKAIDVTRTERARTKQPPLDYNTAYGPLLAKIGETQIACDAYIRDHEARESRDDQSNAARTLRDNLMAVQNGLQGSQTVMESVNRKLRSSESIPSLDDLATLSAVSRDPNVPREIKEQARLLLVGDAAKVRAQVVATGDAELLTQYASLVQQDDVEVLSNDILAKFGDNNALMVSLTSQMATNELNQWSETGEMPLRGNTLTTKLLARFGSKAATVAMQQVSKVTKDLLKGLPHGLKLNPSEFPEGEKVSVVEARRRLTVNGWATPEDIEAALVDMRNTQKAETAENLANTLIVQKKINAIQQAELLTNDAMRANQAAVKTVAETVLATITSEAFLASFGPDVQTLCANLYDATASRKPVNTGVKATDDANAKFCDKIVGGYVLLRLINPTLTDAAGAPFSEAAARETAAKKVLDAANNLAATDPTKAEKVRLAQKEFDDAKTAREEAAETVKYTTLLTKLLQNVSNGSVPSDYLACLHEVITGADEPMRGAFSKLVREGKTVRDGPKVKPPSPTPPPRTEPTTPPPTGGGQKPGTTPLTADEWSALLSGEKFMLMASKMIEAGIERGDAVVYVTKFKALKAAPSVELLTECADQLRKIQAANRDLAGMILRLQLQPIKLIIHAQSGGTT